MTVKGPEPGFVLVYKFAPVEDPDPIGYARARMKRIGWEVLYQDARTGTRYGEWIEVILWARPPAREVTS